VRLQVLNMRCVYFIAMRDEMGNLGQVRKKNKEKQQFKKNKVVMTRYMWYLPSQSAKPDGNSQELGPDFCLILASFLSAPLSFPPSLLPWLTKAVV